MSISLVKRQYDEDIWGLKYRPETIKGLILPDRFIKQFKTIIENKSVPNMLFTGESGCGKTTSAFILADAIEMDRLYLNMSEETGIDVLRTKVKSFCSTKSLHNPGVKKMIIFDEVDRASTALQDGLKAAIEQYSKRCSFVFTTNHKNRIIPELLGRLQQLDFFFKDEERKMMMNRFYKSLIKILDVEKVQYEKKAIIEIISKIFPNFRMILNQLQGYSQQVEKITLEILGKNILIDTDVFFSLLKEKNFPAMRKYIMDLNINCQFFFSEIFKHIEKHIVNESIGEAIIVIAKYNYESAFSADQQIPLTACAVELMAACEFK